ncbi:MAG: hypothetical protein ACYC6N_29900 [Pirellulaceae bacterium]
MNVHEGDRVLVNVAPFIASARRQQGSVPCKVLQVEAGRVLISTQSPYRQIDLWVEECWIDRVCAPRGAMGASVAV